MKNKPRILIIGPYPPIRGGISEFNYNTYKYLKEISAVFVLSIKKSYPSLLFPGKSQFYKSKNNLENFENFNIYNPIEFRKVFRIIREKQINTIITTHWNPLVSFLFAIINRLNKKSIKKIGVIHNVLPHERFPLDYLMLKFYLKSLDTMITLSKNSTNSLHKICYKKAIIKQLYHPIENKKKLNREKSLKILNLDPKNQYLLHFGLVRKYKGLDLLIESMTELIKTNKNLILLIVGEFYSNKEKYLKQITRLKLEKNIKIVDEYVEGNMIDQWFSIADLVIQPNIISSQSGVTALSISFEKKIVTTGTGGIGEVINSNNGYICESNVDSMSKTINYALRDKNFNFDKLKELKDKFNWNSFAKKIMSFINEI